MTRTEEATAMAQAADKRDWDELTVEEQDAESAENIVKYALDASRPGDVSRLVPFAEEGLEPRWATPEDLEQCVATLARMVLELRSRVTELEEELDL
jgi:hypothetical protein